MGPQSKPRKFHLIRRFASLISLQLAVNRLLLEPKTYRYPKWWHPPPGSSRLVNHLNELLVKKQYRLLYIHCLSPTILIALVMLWSNHYNHFSIWAARQSLELCPFPAAGHLGFAARGWNYQFGFSLRISGGRSPIYTSNLRKYQTSQSQHPYGEFLWSVSTLKMFSQRWRRLPKI